ncbi:ATP-binding cassette domain-containing protein [Aerococcaceae bacterium zg-BR22]|uniref:ABC transporter ATP-binding protein n=1 Tax=Aerococcaceae bacterium zg-1292 TaxID=2774330 RepID=UPI004063C150|nr:ATP-binding cassette domain-containing protein [Aerococcaceae bacterium zg-BR22]
MGVIISVDSLSIASGRQTIIDNLSFDIQEGEVVSITGQSGSGKSTVLKYLAQLNDPTLHIAGTYHLFGKEVDTYSPVELRQTVSYFYQTPTLFGDSVRDNLSFPYDIRHKHFDEQHAIEMLQSVDLSAHILDKSIQSLSGGERQRVALIRNLMFPAKVLLLDEISSALDDKTRQIIWQGIEVYKKQHRATILMVSHLKEEHVFAERQIEIVKLAVRGDDHE